MWKIVRLIVIIEPHEGFVFGHNVRTPFKCESSKKSQSFFVKISITNTRKGNRIGSANNNEAGLAKNFAIQSGKQGMV